MFPDSSSPDWSFAANGSRTTVRINLEVKRRPRDIKRFLGFTDSAALFDDISKKFPTSCSQEINVGAITIYSKINRKLAASVQGWLADEQHVHALLIWSEDFFDSPPFAVTAKPEVAGMIRECLSRLDSEDLSGVGIVTHLILDHPLQPKILR